MGYAGNGGGMTEIPLVEAHFGLVFATQLNIWRRKYLPRMPRRPRDEKRTYTNPLDCPIHFFPRRTPSTALHAAVKALIFALAPASKGISRRAGSRGKARDGAKDPRKV